MWRPVSRAAMACSALLCATSQAKTVIPRRNTAARCEAMAERSEPLRVREGGRRFENITQQEIVMTAATYDAAIGANT